MTQKLRTSIPAAIGILVLILDTRTALNGAYQGLELCIRTVIPSLLPFFVLSTVLTSALIGEKISFLRPLGRLMGVDYGAESLILVGMLGGYPAGAQSVSQAYRSGSISKQAAQRMVAFCNLAGPAFLFGIVSGKFAENAAAWKLWGIHLLSAILVAMLLPGKSSNKAALKTGKLITLPEALHRSLKTMALVCGWIILFRVILAFLSLWFLWLLPIPAQVALTGLLELSNGCCDLGRIDNEPLRFVIAAGLLSFGGLCVSMQTASVSQGLSMKNYFIGKALQTLLSVLFAAIVQIQQVHFSAIFWISLVVLIGLLVNFLHKKQKRYSISKPIGV